MNKFSTLARVALTSLLTIGAARADAVDPEVARLNAETARLTAETAMLNARTANAAAQYGPVPTGKEGTITNPEKFSAMGQWTLASATHQAAGVIAQQVAAMKGTTLGECQRDGILVSSVEDRRPAAAAAEVIKGRLETLSKMLAATLQPTGTALNHSRLALLPQVNAFRGLVGTLDSLVGLFRTDYTFSDLTAASNDLSLRIAVAEALSSAQKDPIATDKIAIDGLAGPSSKKLALMVSYDEFDKQRKAALTQYTADFAAATTDAARAKFAGVKALLDAAAALDTALTTPTAGQVPLVTAALALEQSGINKCVLYAKFASYSASLVTRKRLLSRNDEVVAIAGGIVQTAFFDNHGVMVDMNTVRIDRRIGGKLNEIVKNAEPLAASYGDSTER